MRNGEELLDASIIRLVIYIGSIVWSTFSTFYRCKTLYSDAYHEVYY